MSVTGVKGLIQRRWSILKCGRLTQEEGKHIHLLSFTKMAFALPVMFRKCTSVVFGWVPKETKIILNLQTYRCVNGSYSCLIQSKNPAGHWLLKHYTCQNSLQHTTSNSFFRRL